jgi:hypothetical protein
VRHNVKSLSADKSIWARSLEGLAIAVQRHLSKGKIHNFISASSSKATIKRAQQDVQLTLEKLDVRAKLSRRAIDLNGE